MSGKPRHVSLVLAVRKGALGAQGASALAKEGAELELVVVAARSCAYVWSVRAPSRFLLRIALQSGWLEELPTPGALAVFVHVNSDDF